MSRRHAISLDSTAAAPLLEAHPGLSGVYLLPDSRDAFAARARLAEVAERALDVQYFIWESDITGTLLFEALRAAADRGVRVRFLLDDSTTQDLDPFLAALDSHHLTCASSRKASQSRWQVESRTMSAGKTLKVTKQETRLVTQKLAELSRPSRELGAVESDTKRARRCCRVPRGFPRRGAALRHPTRRGLVLVWGSLSEPRHNDSEF